MIQKTDHCINNVGILQRRLEEVEFLMEKVQRQSNTYDRITENIDKFNIKMRQECDEARVLVVRQNHKIEQLETCIAENAIKQDSIVSNLKDMKKLFNDTIKESHDMNSMA